MTVLERSVPPTMLDIAWAAGLYEGEGWCNARQGRIAISQVHLWPLKRMQERFAGSIGGPYKKPSLLGASPYFIWYLSGYRAAAFAMTIYALLSPRRQEQLKTMLSEWRVRPTPFRYEPLLRAIEAALRQATA